MYDKNNIFAKILRKEVPCNKIFENELCLAFYDINPRAKVHALVIPKIDASDFVDFCNKSQDVDGFFKTVSHIATHILHLESFKLQANTGINSGQEVFHFHIHILSN